jgi:hypothetical protein
VSFSWPWFSPSTDEQVVRGLVEEVRIISADGEITIELKGELAGILAVADTAKKGLGSHQDKALQIKMVAGAGFDLHLLASVIGLQPGTAASRPGSHPRSARF